MKIEPDPFGRGDYRFEFSPEIMSLEQAQFFMRHRRKKSAAELLVLPLLEEKRKAEKQASSGNTTIINNYYYFNGNSQNIGTLNNQENNYRDLNQNNNPNDDAKHE